MIPMPEFRALGETAVVIVSPGWNERPGWKFPLLCCFGRRGPGGVEAITPEQPAS